MTKQPATPLPWRVALFKRSDWHVVGGTVKADDYPRAAISKREDDAAYIAHACNAYPRLVEEARRASKTFCWLLNLARAGELPKIEALLAMDAPHSLKELLREIGEDA